MLDVELDSSDHWDQTTDWRALAQNAVNAAVVISSQGWIVDAPFAISISISLSDNEEVQSLNAQWRGKDMPTNVLSFPMLGRDEFGSLGNTDDGEVLIGDMILAYGVCAAEAVEKGVPLAEHAAHLIVHGTLHLLGYDHVDDHDGDIMEALEVKALASLGLANPYEA